jgi:hypothetical protein
MDAISVANGQSCRSDRNQVEGSKKERNTGKEVHNEALEKGCYVTVGDGSSYGAGPSAMG